MRPTAMPNLGVNRGAKHLARIVAVAVNSGPDIRHKPQLWALAAGRAVKGGHSLNLGATLLVCHRSPKPI